MDVKAWDNNLLDKWIDSNIRGFTVDQIGHMAWYLGVKHEQLLREKEMTMQQGDNQTSYGESEDERGPED